MKIFKIYPSASVDSHVCAVMIEGGPEAAMEAVETDGFHKWLLEHGMN